MKTVFAKLMLVPVLCTCSANSKELTASDFNIDGGLTGIGQNLLLDIMTNLRSFDEVRQFLGVNRETQSLVETERFHNSVKTVIMRQIRFMPSEELKTFLLNEAREKILEPFPDCQEQLIKRLKFSLKYMLRREYVYDDLINSWKVKEILDPTYNYPPTDLMDLCPYATEAHKSLYRLEYACKLAYDCPNGHEYEFIPYNYHTALNLIAGISTVIFVGTSRPPAIQDKISADTRKMICLGTILHKLQDISEEDEWKKQLQSEIKERIKTIHKAIERQQDVLQWQSSFVSDSMKLSPLLQIDRDDIWQPVLNIIYEKE